MFIGSEGNMRVLLLQVKYKANAAIKNHTIMSGSGCFVTPKPPIRIEIFLRKVLGCAP